MIRRLRNPHEVPMSRTTTLSTVLAAGIAVVGLAACGGGDDTPVAEAAAEAPDGSPGGDAVAGGDPVPFGLVDPATAASLAQDDTITVIDVRTPEEYAEGHIEGATLFDFYEPTFADQLAELDRNGTYLLYCRSGNRSGQAASIMSELGFDQVYDAQGGVIAYEAAGLPLEN
ncbi:rhodanese-related sulfurtransferase [Ilumatobacter fluminis]|uniref:Rhodanese-related sulfurtransferase n=2 Tax=Ilumatobacter fluminis TaxID=467091 RepID=A0A4R7HZ99_9ACTN|nr:rhodanese-related sulfurtransferase [Ilumatobacter fluminis]